MQFRFTMVETVTIESIYTVEADSLEEARKLAENGETESETPIPLTREVVERKVFSVG